MSIARQTEIMEQSQEDLTGYTAVISSDHAYIHDGIAFTGIINTGSISSAYNISFKTPASTFIHWRPIGIDSSADYVDFVLSEGDTYSGGTAVVPINRNRLSSNTTDMQSFVKGSTVTPTGVIIQRGGIGTSGNRVSQTGCGSGADEELVLKQDTEYTLTLTPDGATICNLSLFWYEEGAGLDNPHGA